MQCNKVSFDNSESVVKCVHGNVSCYINAHSISSRVKIQIYQNQMFKMGTQKTGVILVSGITMTFGSAGADPEGAQGVRSPPPPHFF